MFGRNNDDDGGTETGAAESAEEAPASAEETEPTEPSTRELDVRLDELEDDLESTASTVRAVRSSQAEMTESIEEMNDTVRRLTGVYDRLVAAENPFVDAPRAETESEPSAEPSDQNAEESVVGFDDLDAPDSEASELFDGYTPGDEPTTDEGEAERVADESVSAETTREPVLATLPDGYAGEAFAMEWLAALMEGSGPAGALRAVEHYEEVGWISAEVKHRLVDYIGGPSLDVFVDPMQPREPTAAEHAVSHEYLTVLRELATI